MPSTRTSYLPAIDGLRAFAVGAVMLFHSDHMSGGFLGVDAFFVISGFLITRQMMIEVDKTDRISLREFWGRRARRLLPALTLLLVVVIGYAYRFGYASERLKIHDDAPWALGFALNWHHISASTDYWHSLSSPSPLTHLWSLAVEEQFYLIWPLVTVLLVWRRRNRERTMLIGCLIGALLSFGLMAMVFDPETSTRAYEGTDTRIGALLVGALCATTIVGDRADRLVGALGRRRDLALAIPVLVLGWMWLRVDGRDAWLYRGGFLLHAVLFAALLLGVSCGAAAQPGTGWLARLLTLRPVRWFGQLSYGLYLWHWPVYIALGPDRVHISRWPLTAVRIGATIVAASLSYYLVERPIRYGLQRKPVIRTAMLSVAAIALAAMAILVVPLPESSPAPINVAALTPVVAAATTTSTPSTTVAPAAPMSTTTPPDTATTGTATVDSTTGATTTTVPVDTTTTVPPTTVPRPELHRVLWLGDSIAFTTSPGLVAAMGAIGIEVVDGSFPGVGMLNETGPALFDQIASRTASQKPDLVIFQMSTWDEPYGEDAIYDGLLRMRDLAKSVGAHLLLLPVPPLRADQDHDGFRNDAGAARRLADDDPVDVSFIATTSLWGSTFEYDLDGDHIPERLGDGVHLCPAGSARFAIWLITQLEADYSNLSVADPSTWAVGEWTQDQRYDRVDGGCALLP